MFPPGPFCLCVQIYTPRADLRKGLFRQPYGRERVNASICVLLNRQTQCATKASRSPRRGPSPRPLGRLTQGDAGLWWREAAHYGDLVQEVYFTGKLIHRQGPVAGSRTLRNRFREAVRTFTDIGISKSVPITGQVRFKFQMEMLNAFNNANFVPGGNYYVTLFTNGGERTEVLGCVPLEQGVDTEPEE